MDTAIVKGQKSWIIRSDIVELVVTKLGAMMAPVTFFRNSDAPVQPYFVAPWAEEDTAGIDDPVLVPLRGDFFCMPFGANVDDSLGDKTHGQVAGNEWTLVNALQENDRAGITLEIDSVRDKWSVKRELMLLRGQSVVYSRTIIAAGGGQLSVGHHATLAPPESGLQISTSPLQFGMTAPRNDLYTNERQYFAHPPLEEFSSLAEVPSIWKSEPTIDRSTFPSRRGFVDIIGVFPSADVDLAWTAASAARDGYVWFAVRDRRLLPTTLFWMEDHGQHGAPWSGRTCCIGLEDVCGYFAEGLPASTSENPLTQRGIPTSMELSDSQPTVIPYIQGVARVDGDFGAIVSIDSSEQGFALVGESGQTVSVPARASFLIDGQL